MNDHIPASLQAMYEELARLMIERDGFMKLMREATAEADLDQLAVLLPGISSVRLDIQDVETSISIRQRQLAEEAKEQARLAALAALPVVTRFAPIGNYYGTPCVFKAGGRFFFGITCAHGPQCAEVDEAFYKAFLSNFPNVDFDEVAEVFEVRQSVEDMRTDHFTLLTSMEAQ